MPVRLPEIIYLLEHGEGKPRFAKLRRPCRRSKSRVFASD